MGCPVEPMDLMRYLAEVGGMPNHDEHVYYAEPILRLRAMAALAWVLFRQFFWSPYPDCFEAAHAASILKQCSFQCQVLAISGFVPPIVLRIAGWLSTLQARHAKLDARAMFEDSEEMDMFWTTYEEYLERQKIEEENRLAKVAKAPNQYHCAADGCGIQAVNKSALRKCGGHCPLDQKPHYCSADCQAQVSTAGCSKSVFTDSMRRLNHCYSTGSSIDSCVKGASVRILLRMMGRLWDLV